MTGTLIATTAKESVRALAFQGIMVYTCFAQISDMLRRKFGDEYVLLFARPVENAANGVMDWYSPVQGEPRKMDDLPEAERQTACARAQAVARDIMLYAEELIKSPDPLKVTRGNVLKLALSYPDDSYLYVVGQQPVFVCWGFGPGTPGVEPKVLSRLAVPRGTVSAEPCQGGAAPVASAPSVGRGGLSLAWLWWFFPLLAAILLLLVLFTSFGTVPALTGVNLFQGPALPFLEGKKDPRDQIAALEKEIAELDRKLESHAALCRPADQGSSAPVPQTPGQELVIPPKAHDASFLEGHWLCDTGLYSKRSGEEVQFAFSFGKDGHGQAVVYEKNDECVGASRASMDGGVLRIALDPQKCRKQGNFYSPVQIVCQSVRGQNTECTGINDDGSRWTATFRKVK